MAPCFAHALLANAFPSFARGALRSRSISHASRRRPRTAYSSTFSASASGVPTAPPLTLFFSDLYKHPLPAGHRFPMEKYEFVRAFLQSAPVMANTRFVPAPLATRAELEQVHKPAYVQRVLRGTLSNAETRAIGFPWSLAGVRRSLGSTGGTVAAVRAVLADAGGSRLAGHTAGGTHHAGSDAGGGFCVFNDLAVGARVALREFGVRSVLVLDLDVHQGEGTNAIFRNVEEVYTVSVHAEGNYPFHKVAGDVDLGLADGVEDEEYLGVVGRVVAEAMAAARPGLVLLQMGVDGLREDSLGRLALSREGLSRRNKMVYRAVLKAGVPAVITMGGGYSKPTIDASVKAHCDVYTDAADVLAEELELERVAVRQSSGPLS